MIKGNKDCVATARTIIEDRMKAASGDMQSLSINNGVYVCVCVCVCACAYVCGWVGEWVGGCAGTAKHIDGQRALESASDSSSQA